MDVANRLAKFLYKYAYALGFPCWDVADRLAKFLRKCVYVLGFSCWDAADRLASLHWYNVDMHAYRASRWMVEVRP